MKPLCSDALPPQRDVLPGQSNYLEPTLVDMAFAAHPFVTWLRTKALCLQAA